MAEYKIILLGDPGVGKTTFFLRLRDGEFVDTENRPTASIGVDDMEYQHVVEGMGIKVCRVACRSKQCASVAPLRR